jgi:two-component system sensor histidine kinase UhpB
LVVTAIGSLQETDDPLRALRRFYESLGDLRHVDVKVMEAGDASPVLSVKPTPESQSQVPSWFVDLGDVPVIVEIGGAALLTLSL